MASRPIRKVTDVIGMLAKGKFAECIDGHLEEALRTLGDLPAEKGRATITITLDLAYEGGRLDVKPSVKSKLPEEGFRSTPFWATGDNHLSVEHPNQADMFAGPRDPDAADFDDRRGRA